MIRVSRLPGRIARAARPEPDEGKAKNADCVSPVTSNLHPQFLKPPNHHAFEAIRVRYAVRLG